MTYRTHPLRFAAWFMGVGLALPVVSIGWAGLTGQGLPQATTLVPMMVAAGIEGRAYARDTGHAPAGPDGWRLAIGLAAFGLVLAAAVAFIVTLFRAELAGDVAPIGPITSFTFVLFAIFGLAGFAIFTVITRLFLHIGAQFAP